MATPTRLRSVCFTLNNYTDEHVEHIQQLNCRYCVIGYEVGAQGTRHLQGFIHFENPRSFNAIRRDLFNAHIEPRRGTPKQAADYCKKDKNFWEKGDLPEQGQRTDLQQLVEDLKTNYGGDTVAMAISEPDRAHRYIRFMQHIACDLQEKRNWEMQIIWCVGPTGSGKSRWANETFGDSLYVKNLEDDWWENYHGEETVLFDDFRGSVMKFSTWLRLCDRYPLMLKVKNSQAQFRSKRIVFTSIKRPENCWDLSDEPLGQLMRRITQIKEFPVMFPDNQEGIEEFGLLAFE